MSKREIDFKQSADFAGRILASRHWLNSSLDLLETVKLLEPVVRSHWKEAAHARGSLRSLMMHKTFFLLAGLCLENLLKSRIVKYNRKDLRSETTESGKLPKSLAGNHNLAAYAKAAKVSLSDQDLRTLSRLTRAVRWSGRYPFPSAYWDWDSDNYSTSDLDEVKRLVNDLFDRVHRPPNRPAASRQG